MAWLGVGYVLWPPRQWRWPLTIAAGLLVWAVAQNFIPFVGSPKWLNTILPAGLEQPDTISISPAVSWLQFFPAMGGLLACWWFMGQRWGNKEIKYLVRGLCVVTGALTTIAAICLMTGVTHPNYPQIGFFSYFANRNQSATLYALTTVIALGMFFFERRWRWRSLGAVVVFIGLVALSSNPSRGGWVSLAIGSLFVLWHTRHRFLLITLAAVAGALIVLVVSPQAVTRQSTSNKAVRLSYAQSALEMTQDNPLGVGLGNFRYVFGHYQKVTPLDTIAVHPENDWLWLLSELGWPALLLLVAIGGLRLNTKDRRAPIVMGVIAAIMIPSLFDVPLHRLGLLIPLLAISAPLLTTKGSVAIRPNPLWALAPVLVLGLSWKIVMDFSHHVRRLNAAYQTLQPELIQKIFPEVQRLTPYDFSLYQNFAQHYLYEGNDLRKANEYAYKALATHPKLPLLPQQLAYNWRKHDIKKSMSLWRESLRRADKADRPNMLLTGIMMHTNIDEFPQLSQMCEDNPRMWEIFLARPEALPYIDKAIERGVDVTRLECTHELLNRWSSDPNRAADSLAYLKAQHPSSRYIARAYATLGQYQEAVEHYFATHEETKIEDKFNYLSVDELRLQMRLKMPPRSNPFALALLKRALEVSDTRTANEILNTLLVQENPPLEAVEYKAHSYAQDEMWRGAWELLQKNF